MIIHNTINYNLKKLKFIENSFKELTKIPNIELLSDDDDVHKINKFKNLISKLILNTELDNYNMRITIKLSYYYDKLFYFISIIDENILQIKILHRYYNNNLNIDTKKN